MTPQEKLEELMAKANNGGGLSLEQIAHMTNGNYLAIEELQSAFQSMARDMLMILTNAQGMQKILIDKEFTTEEELNNTITKVQLALEEEWKTKRQEKETTVIDDSDLEL